MTDYKNLSYTLTARYATITGEGVNKAWNENLSTVKITENSDSQNLKENAQRIIESFKRLLQTGSSVDEEKSKLTADEISINEIAMEISEDPSAGINTGTDAVRFSLTIRSTNQLGSPKNAKLPGGLESNIDSDTTPIINTAARALIALSNNSYSDTFISTSLNVYDE